MVHPAIKAKRPTDIVNNADLTRAQKIEALDNWAVDVERRLASTGEGMPGQGQTDADLALLDEIRDAKQSLTGDPRPTHQGRTS